MSTSRYIIRLNPVDWLTISGVVTSALAIGAMLDGQFLLAVSLLYLAMLGDALDGIWARKLQIERNFGRYLDGFMDVLIYLVAPALWWYLQGFDGGWSICLLLMVGAGCVRLSVFNDIGNIQESTGLAYLGMPVFWSLFILGAYALVQWVATPHVAGGDNTLIMHSVLAILLCVFSHAMLWRAPFFKFKKLWHILLITVGGSCLFLSLHVWG